MDSSAENITNVWHYSVFENGSFREEKWYCDCGKLTALRTSEQPNEHKGKSFWRCQNLDSQCSFFLWLEDEATAMSHHQPHLSPLPILQTPTKTNIPAQLPETPFSLKKRGLTSTDFTNSDDNDNANDQSRNSKEHARKLAKSSIFSTPGKQSAEKGKSSVTQLPTPDSRANTSVNNPRLESLHAWDASPTRMRSKTLSLERDDDPGLFISILELLRSNGHELKYSTQEKLRTLIDSKLEQIETQIHLSTA